MLFVAGALPWGRGGAGCAGAAGGSAVPAACLVPRAAPSHASERGTSLNAHHPQGPLQNPEDAAAGRAGPATDFPALSQHPVSRPRLLACLPLGPMRPFPWVRPR